MSEIVDEYDAAVDMPELARERRRRSRVMNTTPQGRVVSFLANLSRRQ